MPLLANVLTPAQPARRRFLTQLALFPGVVAAALLLGTSACAREGLESIPLEVSGQRLTVELARTEAEQARGLMYRTELPDNHGMLFVYTRPTQVAYWMKNTFIPLSIAFIDSKKRIVNIADMAPNNETRTYPSAGPVQYVLEVNQGWFTQHQVKPGDLVTFELPKLQR